MTRSVEIPEEAVLAATRALAKTFATNKPIAGTKDFEVDARAALEAALPYLAPAVPQPVDREALAKALQEAGDVHPTPILPGWYIYAADAVLAVLAGEQEQVESPEL